MGCNCQFSVSMLTFCYYFFPTMFSLSFYINAAMQTVLKCLLKGIVRKCKESKKNQILDGHFGYPKILQKKTKKLETIQCKFDISIMNTKTYHLFFVFIHMYRILCKKITQFFDSEMFWKTKQEETEKNIHPCRQVI